MKKSKGFSLVELIIVIAIMAILVGILAPNLMKNIEKSRVSKDKTIVDNCCTAVVNALADPDAYDSFFDGTTTDAATTTTSEDVAYSGSLNGLLSKGGPTWQKELKDNLKGMEGQTFTSKNLKGKKVGENVTVKILGDSSVECTTADSKIKSSK